MVQILRPTVTLGLLLAAAACGTPTNGAVGDPGPSVSTGSRPTGGPTASATVSGPTGQPNQAHPDARVTDQRPIRWTRAEAGAGQQVVIHYTVAGRAECNTLGRVDIAETASAVTATVLVGHLPGANCGGDQPLLAAQFLTTVTLTQPLGARTIIDGAR